MSEPDNQTTDRDAFRDCRERALLNAAEDVLTRWAIVRASDGKLGSCGMPEALKALDVACEAYTDEGDTTDDDTLPTAADVRGILRPPFDGE